MTVRRIIIGSIVLLLFAGAALLWSQSAPPDVRGQFVGTATAAGSDEGFPRVTEPLPLAFPQDQGPHPAYQTEWWYYVGNLVTEDGRRFGYQFTVFRRALTPQAAQRTSDWGTNQVYGAHFALTDVSGRQFYAWERYSRGAAGLAGAQASPYRVWVEDWSVSGLAAQTERIVAAQDVVSLDLTLTWSKPPALHGNAGLSQKGSQPGNASMYYSLTRLATQGTVTLNGQTFAVRGTSWMDHEFGTSALGEQAVGWDWFALQLDDQRELMFFLIRRQDGTFEPQSSGSLVEADGRVRRLSRDDVQITVLETWESPRSGGRYPAAWRVEVPSISLTLDITPRLANQELNLSNVYWEGAVQFSGDAAGRPVSGQGYIELTGYVNTMRGQF